ncbi:MAG: methyltransferase domain-containing protein [Verrucomicrobia bacterium]|nr:methyltransferase domain-containing protein [Verrucomicrobiota bacterium]
MKEDANKSHPIRYSDYADAAEVIKKRIKAQRDIPNCSYDQVCQILDHLMNSPLGRHILQTGGANGIWTDYMISFPWVQKNIVGRMLSMNRLEYFIIFEMPSVLAQRELFLHSQKIAQRHIKANNTLASLPCGVMRDLLELDANPKANVQFVGIDIDNESLSAAKKLAQEKGISNVSFEQKDAWNLGIFSEFDFITSIGLNCYEPDRGRVVELYRQIYQSLKPGGTFFTGVLTYPPGYGAHSDWDLTAIPKYHIEMDQLLTRDILDLQYQNYRTLDEIEDDFRNAGFSTVSVYPDRYRIFPAVIAVKG